MIFEHTESNGDSPSSHLLSSSSLTLVTPPSTHVANLVLQPHMDLQFLSLPTSGVPHSRAHLNVSQSGGADVVVLIEVLVACVVMLVVCVVIEDTVLVIIVVDVVVSVSVAFVDDFVVDEMLLVLEVSVVVGSAVVVVVFITSQFVSPRFISAGHSVVSNEVHVSDLASQPHSDTRQVPSLAVARQMTLLISVCRHSFEHRMTAHGSGSGRT